jgi:hypothetical protein
MPVGVGAKEDKHLQVTAFPGAARGFISGTVSCFPAEINPIFLTTGEFRTRADTRPCTTSAFHQAHYQQPKMTTVFSSGNRVLLL